MEKSPQPRKSYHLYSNYLLSIRLMQGLFFYKLLIHLALQKAFNIFCIYTEKKWSLGDFNTLAAIHTTKNDFKKKQVSDSVLLSDTVFMAPSSKILLPGLLMISTSESHPAGRHVNSKTCNRSADVWGVREIIGCIPMPHSLLLFVP